MTIPPQQHPRSLNNEIVTRQMIDEINAEREKSDRLTVAKLNTVKQFNKQNYKSKLMTEKYSLLPLNSQQLTPVQTAIQRMSEKHLDFEIEPVNTIQPPEIEYTQMLQALVPIDTSLSIIHKHIPRQSDIDKIVGNIETRVIHSLELPIQAQDLVKAYQHSTHFRDIYQYITNGKLPSGTKAQNCIRAEALNYVVINILLRIDTQKDKDIDKGNSFLLVIPEKYELIIFNTYHDSLLAGHQGPYHTAMTIRQKFFIHNLMNKVKRYIETCHTCLKTKPKYMKNRPIYGRIPVDYAPMQDLSIDIKTMPQAFGGYHLLLVITCDQTNFTIAIPLRDRTAQTIAEALIYRVIYLFGPPRQIISDEATEFTSTIIQAILCMLNCRLKVISPYNHGSSKCERQIRMISEIIMKHLWDKGQMWPLFATTAAYAMNTFTSEALSGLSPFQLVFLRDPPDLTSLSFPKIDTIPVKHREYYNLLLARAQLVGNMLLEWRTKQALEYGSKVKKFRNKEIFQDNQMVYLLAPHASVLQTNTTKFKQDFIGPLFIDTALDKTHYRLKDATGLLLDGTYHVNHIKKGSACTPLGIVNKFDTYETALKNTLLNKFAIKTPNNKLQEVTLQDGSKKLNYLPGIIMDYATLHS